ncbi:hypothetical protein F4677DRAFT_312268 [Hypoxylon crocopeplum]|nr:hypothetical protein F4677DRAFT_312268 [Hypoxylon crocopeplum]
MQCKNNLTCCAAGSLGGVVTLDGCAAMPIDSAADNALQAANPSARASREEGAKARLKPVQSRVRADGLHIYGMSVLLAARFPLFVGRSWRDTLTECASHMQPFEGAWRWCLDQAGQGWNSILTPGLPLTEDSLAPSTSPTYEGNCEPLNGGTDCSMRRQCHLLHRVGNPKGHMRCTSSEPTASAIRETSAALHRHCCPINLDNGRKPHLNKMDPSGWKGRHERAYSGFDAHLKIAPRRRYVCNPPDNQSTLVFGRTSRLRHFRCSQTGEVHRRCIGRVQEGRRHHQLRLE